MKDQEIKALEHTEPILAERGNKKYILGAKPEYPDIWDSYVKQKRAFWDVDSIDLSKDIDHWKEKLNDDERHFLSYVLAFFASSDTIVMSNISINFDQQVQIQEAKLGYAFQNMMEGIHSEIYSLLIQTYVEKDKQAHLFNAIEEIPAVKKKAEWAISWLGNLETSFAQRLIAFACVECIQFSSSFASIAYMGKRGFLPGLTQANSYIRLDEAEHVRFAVMLYNHLNNRLDEEIVHRIVREAVQIEEEFCSDALPVALIGMNAKEMQTYVRFVADYLLGMLKYTKIYNVTNPFSFMDNQSLESKENFFEKKSTNYATFAPGDKNFNIDEDF